MTPCVFGARIPPSGVCITQPVRRCGDQQQKTGAAGVHWWPVVAYTRWVARGCQNAPRASTYQLWSWGQLCLKPGGPW